MTIAQAQAAAADLRVSLLDHGVQAVSLELQAGVGPKADPWGPAPFVRGMGHHIASRPSQGDTPGLSLVKAGRTGKNALQGPVCNGYGGFDLVARIITMGWANHAGEGGPWPVDGWGTVPRNEGRPRIFGWEFEGGYEPYTDEMHDFMARCGAGTLDWLGVLNHREPAPLDCWGEHKEPWAPGRKVDRIGYTAASGRARIAGIRKNPTPAVLEEDPVLTSVAPGKTEVIPLPAIPPGKKLYVRFAVDELAGGCNARVAVGWGDQKWHPLPDLDKIDGGFAGWLVNGRRNEAELGGADAVLSVTHYAGARNPLGVLLQLR